MVVSGQSVLSPGRDPGCVVNQFRELEAGLGLDSSHVVPGSLVWLPQLDFIDFSVLVLVCLVRNTCVRTPSA